MQNTGTGVRMKSQRGRGGVVEDVVYRRIDMKEIGGQCIQITLNYHPEPPTNKTATPVFKNILLEDIRCDKVCSRRVCGRFSFAPFKQLPCRRQLTVWRRR